MSRDWNIIDDSEGPAEPPSPDDSRLDAERIRRIARERRAADRVTQWKLGGLVLAILAATITAARVAWWLLN